MDHLVLAERVEDSVTDGALPELGVPEETSAPVSVASFGSVWPCEASLLACSGSAPLDW